MKRKILAVLAMGVGLLMIGWFSLSAKALSTTPTQFLQEIPLQISAYGWNLLDETGIYDSATNPYILRYVQLYNDSDTPLSLSEWRLAVEDTTSATVPTEVLFTSTANGWLAPHSHVVASYDGFVGGATYNMNSEVQLINMSSSSSSPVKLIISSLNTNVYQPAEYVLRLDSVNAASSYWQRNFSSTGEGYTSAFSALATAPSLLFDDGLYQVPVSPDVTIVEVYPYSSVCAPDNPDILCGDYIKLHVGENVDLAQFVLRTSSSSASRTSSNTVWLGSTRYQPNANGYITLDVTDDGDLLNLTNGGGYVWLEDLYGLALYSPTMTSYPSATSVYRGWSWALDSHGTWQWTSTPQPGKNNLITIPSNPVCPEGKYLNPETGRCRTLEEAINTLAACPEGQTRNPATNRCRQNTTQSSTLKPCAEGQERNPLTNRCRSIASAVAELIPCDEGQERNPLTNRCRKVTDILSASDTITASKDVNLESAQSSTVWGWALVGVAAAGVIGYGIYEWRSEITKAGRSLLTRFTGK